MMKDKQTLETLGSLIDIDGVLIPQLRSVEANPAKSNPLFTFLITIVLFFSAKIVNANLLDVSILVLVLLLHETGHFIMMKILKYDDVKMFFIPFLGAAVSGKSKDDSTLKSCAISIMGPLPGVVLAVLSFVLFSGTRQYAFLKFTEVALFLNVFNFLPILPLDGGKFVETLFYHNRIGRLAFACFGMAAFIIAGIALRDWLFVVIGGLSLFSIVPAFKLMGVSRRQLGRGPAFDSVSALLSDRERFDPMVVELANAFPAAFAPALKSRDVHSYLERILAFLRMKPAKAAAKAALFFLYSVLLVASLALALLFAVIGYRETVATKTVNGADLRYGQTYMYGSLYTEIPIDPSGYLDGEGSSYEGKDGGQYLDGRFYYENGYRNGVWPDYDEKGTIIKKTTYERGKLIGVDALKDGRWVHKDFGQLGFYQRFLEWLGRLSGPRKSLARYFD
jgi:Zn-dependent protease